MSEAFGLGLQGLRKGGTQQKAIVMEFDMPDEQISGEYFVSNKLSNKAWKLHQVEPLQMAAILQISVSHTGCGRT